MPFHFKATLLLALLPALLAAPLRAQAAPPAAKRPNFIFVITDDQRWDALGVVQREQGEKARFPWLKTPNLDRIAAEGVRFRNAFTTYSLCSPARSAILTGQYNHLNGVGDNHAPFPLTNLTYAHLQQDAGYLTGYFGKFHHGKQRGPRPGFTYNASFTDQGVYADCPFEVNGVMTPTTGWVDDVTVAFAVDFIRQNRERPFSLHIGLKSPHEPTKPPERTLKTYAGETARVVPNLTVPAIYRLSAADTKRRDLAERAQREGTGVEVNLDWFRCITAADESIGRLLKALDDLGLTENTVLVFTSDGGTYLGEHCLGDKRSGYEESLRIPLLVRYPARFPRGAVVDDLVLNLDIAPTLVDLSSVPAPRQFQGRSLVPLAEGRSVNWRRSFLAEYFIDKEYPNTPTWVGVRTADAKLIRYPGYEQWTELFDLRSDPYETRNLAADPAHRALRDAMEAELSEQMQATDYRFPHYANRVPFRPEQDQ
jgi:arylsulfatase A-like enzyme